MIQDIPFSIFINSEFIGLMTNIVNTCNDDDAVALKIDAQVADVDTGLDAVNALFITQKKSIETPKVVSQDALRDRYFTGIKKVVEGFTYHFDENVVKAATVLELCIDKYGKDVTKQSLVTETTTLDSLAGDFESKPEVAAALALLRIADWGQVLKQTNIDFNTTYLTRNVEYAERPEGEILPLREVVQAKYEILKRHIEGHQLFTPSAAYDRLINKINSLISQYKTTAKRRRAGGGGEDNDTPSA